MEKCCSECPEPRVAQSLCTFCNKWLCFQCTDLHQHERSAAQPSEPRQQQTASSSPASSETGSSCCGRAVVMCPHHKQETLELFCETCDLLACSICHLSTHKDHRLVHVGKALQDQRWLLENLMARVEEKRSAVENTAKQIQGRLHSVKITQRKAENQIKMAKMIMINELNKRANLLIEQLESISSGFKHHLEDQLQGVIELCSQLEHVQNFITWAVAHHRRNPLLFSKELIALQMQQLLEPLMQSETWVPLKIKFNWDASIWTKQISNLGQLSVEGGNRSFSEGVGRILRPQPVPCMTLPSFCYPVREAECAYQSCCKPQLCCLHCRPTQSVPLEKYPLTPDKYPLTYHQQPSCSSHSSHQRHWETESTTVSPQLTVFPSQLPSVPDPVRESHSETLLRQPAASDHQSHCERISTTSDPNALSSKDTDIQSQGSREQVHLLRRCRDQEVHQAEQQPSSDSGATLGQDQQLVISNQYMASTGSDMLSREAECESNAESMANSKTGSYSISAEPSSSSNVPWEGRPSEAIQCLATVNKDQGCTAQQDKTRSIKRHTGSDIMVIPLSPGSCDVSSQTMYKTEPVGVSEHGTSMKQTYRKPPDGSKIPVVCLERLTVLVSKHPPLGRQRHHPTGSELKSGGTVSLEQGRQISTEVVPHEESAQEVEEYPLPVEPSADFYTVNAATVHSSDLEHSLQTESEEEHFSEPKQPDTLMSEPTSDYMLEPTTENDFGSEEEVDLELQAESEPSLRSEPRVESDSESDLVSERPPELENSGESEQELISEPDATAEMTLNLEQEQEWEEEQVATDQNTRAELSVVHQDHTEMESEDFCAVCFIGGELLCCDRCPKVFHLSCHVPALLSFPVGDWVCTLCRDVKRPEVEYDCEDSRLLTDAVPSGLPACDQRKCEKLSLLIYSNILSAPFHEPVSPLARHYYQIIKRPMDLSVIRNRLNRSSPSHYCSVGEFVDDILLMFKNCAKFNYPDSEVAQAGRSLQSFFFSKLSEVFPELSCPAPDDDLDDESDDYEETECTTAVAFPWPERREQSHRKRKRRHSLNWRRHHY